MEDLKLIYINHLGRNWQDNNLYEFIFGEETDGETIEGDDWDVFPASSGKVTPPNIEAIKSVGIMETDILLDVIKDSDVFSVLDCLDGIVPLGYENIMDYSVYPENRMVFPFGLPYDNVKSILYGRDIILEFKKIKNEN